MELSAVVQKQSNNGLTSNTRLLVLNRGLLYYFSKVPKAFKGDVNRLEQQGILPKYFIEARKIKKMSFKPKKNNVLVLEMDQADLNSKQIIRRTILLQQFQVVSKKGTSTIVWIFAFNSLDQAAQWYKAILFEQQNPSESLIKSRRSSERNSAQRGSLVQWTEVVERKRLQQLNIQTIMQQPQNQQRRSVQKAEMTVNQVIEQIIRKQKLAQQQQRMTEIEERSVCQSVSQKKVDLIVEPSKQLKREQIKPILNSPDKKNQSISPVKSIQDYFRFQNKAYLLLQEVLQTGFNKTLFISSEIRLRFQGNTYAQAKRNFNARMLAYKYLQQFLKNQRNIRLPYVCIIEWKGVISLAESAEECQPTKLTLKEFNCPLQFSYQIFKARDSTQHIVYVDQLKVPLSQVQEENHQPYADFNQIHQKYSTTQISQLGWMRQSTNNQRAYLSSRCILDTLFSCKGQLDFLEFFKLLFKSHPKVFLEAKLDWIQPQFIKLGIFKYHLERTCLAILICNEQGPVKLTYCRRTTFPSWLQVKYPDNYLNTQHHYFLKEKLFISQTLHGGSLDYGKLISKAPYSHPKKLISFLELIKFQDREKQGLDLLAQQMLAYVAKTFSMTDPLYLKSLIALAICFSQIDTAKSKSYFEQAYPLAKTKNEKLQLLFDHFKTTLKNSHFSQANQLLTLIQAQVKVLTPPYSMFLLAKAQMIKQFYPLQHSDYLISCIKGLELIDQLCLEVSWQELQVLKDLLIYSNQNQQQRYFKIIQKSLKNQAKSRAQFAAVVFQSQLQRKDHKSVQNITASLRKCKGGEGSLSSSEVRYLLKRLESGRCSADQTVLNKDIFIKIAQKY